MYLHEGILFHNRYLLIEKLGIGASANVWLANDVKANNMTVALKIFTNNSDLGTDGIQNFKREFTSVYNMKHTNLLPPTGYDIMGTYPYLIMQYCAKGSCSSLVGRCSEDKIIKFLHDVAAGLEYLHAHNMIHQDIKPDNILIDDDEDFLLTDFGISVESKEGGYNDEVASNGTRAYMAPERFKGVTIKASDIWSLGATAYEMLTGYPPFGDHGGILQGSEALHELPSTLQPEVKNIILSCLDEDPARRITAAQIRQKIETYRETGSWYKHNNKLSVIVTSAILSVIVCLGIYLWDFNRVKVHYYKDYYELYGVPQGIGRVSSATVGERLSTYCFEYKKNKLIRLSLVNSRKKIIGHNDVESMNSRYADMRFSYTDNGKIDCVIVYNPEGRTLFKMDYDDNLRSVTFKHNDDNGTEKNLDASTTTLHKESNIFDAKSIITRYLLTYDDRGLLTERRFAGFQNVAACDADGIYGQRYKHDDKGRIIEELFLGRDYDICGNKIGLAIKQYEYDENDNRIKVTYLDASGTPSHDGKNCSVLRIEYDEFGNRIKEIYYDADGTPVMRTDMGAFGCEYTVTNGLLTELRLIDSDYKPMVGKSGVAVYAYEYDDNGFNNKLTCLDANNNAIRHQEDGITYSQVQTVNNQVGQMLEICFFDELGNKLTNENGYFRNVREYDSIGNCISESYFFEDGSPAQYKYVYHKAKYAYDEYGNLVSERYYDAADNLIPDEMGVAEYKLAYNIQGAVIKFQCNGTDSTLVYNKDGISYFTIDYDSHGNKSKINYFDADGKLHLLANGYASIHYKYDDVTNLLVSEGYLDTKNDLIIETKYEYDNRGNIVKLYSIDKEGRLLPNTAVLLYEYNNLNQEISVAHFDIDNKKINAPGYKYHRITFVYDKYGNIIEESFWGTNNKPAKDKDNTHKRIKKYDLMNRQIYEKNLGIDGKPLKGNNVNAEFEVERDVFGNIIMLKSLNGYGEPSLSSEGYHIMRVEYNNRNKEVRKYFLGVNDEPVESDSLGFHKIETEYDYRGNDTLCYFYDKNNICFRIHKVRLNSQDRIEEFFVYDGNNILDDKAYGFSRYTITYDKSGVMPLVKEYYNNKGTLILNQKYDKIKQEWGDYETVDNYSASSSNNNSKRYNSTSENSNWMQDILDAAKECPVKLDDDIILLSLKVSGNSVTVVLKLIDISKYALSSDETTNLRNIIKNETSPTLRGLLNLPKNVNIKIVLVDKAEREICKI